MGAFVTWPHPALSLSAQHRPIDDKMLAAGARLLEAADGVKAFGLAAAHIGLVEPVVVVSVADDLEKRDYRVMYLPRIEAVAPETAAGAEGSVSMPGIEVPVVRPIWAEVVYQSRDGASQIVRLDGFAARVALHEIEQLEGVFFLQRVSRIKRETALRKFQKSQRVAG